MTITVTIEMKSAAAGGRATSFGAGYCPHLVVEGAAEMLGVRAAAGTGLVCPGQTALVEFEALYPETVSYERLRPGVRVRLVEGSRTIATGIVAAVAE